MKRVIKEKRIKEIILVNEKIKELIEECTTVENGVMQVRRNETVYHFDKVKFAELIVKECLDIAKRNISEPSGWDADYDEQNQSARRAEVIYNEIRQHFGVK